MSTMTPSRSAPSPRRENRPRPSAPPKSTTTIDPFRVLRRYILLIVASGVVGTALGVGAHFMFGQFYPLFSSKVLFEIRPGLDDVRDVGTNDIGQDQLVTRLASTETVLLTSRDVLEAAVVDQQVRGTRWFKDNFVADDGRELIDEAVDDLIENLKTSVMRNTNLFQVQWSTHHPRDLPAVLNTIAESYLNKRKSLDAKTYQENLNIFRNTLESTQNDVEDLDLAIARHIRETGMGTLEDPRDSQVAYTMRSLMQQITDVTSQLSMAQSGLLQTEAKLKGTIEPTSEDRMLAEHDPSVMSHINLVLALKTELRQHYEVYNPDHTVVQRMESRLRATEAERDSKVDEIMRRNLEAKRKELQDQVESMKSTMDRLAEEYESKGLELRELAANQSEYESKATQREYLIAQRDADLSLIKEVQLMQLRDDARRVRLAQTALEPRDPSFPKIELVVPLGMLLVVSLTVALIFLREFTDQRVKSASDIAVIPGAQVLGIIPDTAEDPTGVHSAELVVRKEPHSILAESYRQAFTSITKAMDRAGHQTLLLVGGLPGSGTTTAATNLAAAWAAAGRRVLLIDANFRRPRLAEALDVTGNVPGLGDVLAGSVTLNEAASEVVPGIDVMTAGSPGNRVYELLNTRQFDSLLAEVRDHYDVAVFDAPPAVVAGEAAVLANKVDAGVLVVRAFQEQRGLVARLIHQLSDAHCDLLGVLLNRPRGTAGGYFKKNFAAMAAYTPKREETPAEPS